MNENHLKVELAKSWISLAHLLIILAGFLFATAGIMYTSHLDSILGASSILNSAFDINNNCLKTSERSGDAELAKICYAYINGSFGFINLLSNTAIQDVVLWRYLTILGLFISLLSALSFLKGRNELKKLETKVTQNS